MKRDVAIKGEGSEAIEEGRVAETTVFKEEDVLAENLK